MKHASLFRPCIDLHDGQVKQIVGGSLTEDETVLIENHISEQPSTFFADLFQRDQLRGGHVIKLGARNEEAAKAALIAYPAGLQIGGGINAENAAQWLDNGADKVIVTSWLFDELGRLQSSRLERLLAEIGAERLVIDLSCRRSGSAWFVATNRWQTITDFEIVESNLDWLANYASEFLIHAADVEGLCQGFDHELVDLLGRWGKLPLTYAGGIASIEDIELLETISRGRVDFTVGSALDLFGGRGLKYQDLVNWNRARQERQH